MQVNTLETKKFHSYSIGEVREYELGNDVKS